MPPLRRSFFCPSDGRRTDAANRRKAAGGNQSSTRRQLRLAGGYVLDKNWCGTGVAESGTVEEIDEFVCAGKPAMLYFSSRIIDPNRIDLKQLKKTAAVQRHHLRDCACRHF